MGTSVSSIPGSPWMPSPTAIRPSGTVNSGSAAPGSVQPVKATPNDRVRSLARRATRSTSSREQPSSAAAQATLKTVRSPAMPRRFCTSSGVALQMSSVTSTVRQSMPSAAQLVLGGVEVQHVTGVVAVAEQHPPPLVRRLRDGVGLLGRRRGEQVAHRRAVGQAGADEAREGRVVPGSAADHDGDRGFGRPGGADHAAGHRPHPAPGGGDETLDHLVEEVVGVVEQSRHCEAPSGVVHAGHRARPSTEARPRPVTRAVRRPRAARPRRR